MDKFLIADENYIILGTSKNIQTAINEAKRSAMDAVEMMPDSGAGQFRERVIYKLVKIVRTETDHTYIHTIKDVK